MYILIEETGEYSSMDYTPIEIHTTFEDAENSRVYHMEKLSIKNKIASLYGNWNSTIDYVIYEVNQPEPIVNIDETLNQLRQEYEGQLTIATSWKKEFDLQKEIETNIATTNKLKEQKEQIDAFIHWWDHENDPYFQDKKAAKLREIKVIVQLYLLKTNDTDVLHWFREKNLV